MAAVSPGWTIPLLHRKAAWLPFLAAGAVSVALLAASSISGPSALPAHPAGPGPGGSDFSGPAAINGWG